MANVVSFTADFEIYPHYAVNAVAQKWHAVFVSLSKWKLDVWLRRRFQIRLLDRSHYSNDLYRPRPCIVIVNHHPLSDRGAVRKMIFRQHTAHDRDGSTIAIVFLTEMPACQKWNSHRTKITRSDDAIVRGRRVLRSGWRFVRSGEMNKRDALRRERKDRHQTGVLNSGKRSQTRLKLLVKLNNGGAISVTDLRQRKANGQNIRGGDT